MVAMDAGFESQHFDRKEAGRPEADGTVHNAKLRNIRDLIEEYVSVFANATGGLLVLGVSSTGAVIGSDPSWIRSKRMRPITWTANLAQFLQL